MKRINSIFLNPDENSGPHKWCDICKAYYAWIAGVYRCPQCGVQVDPIESSKKVLKADVSEPIIVSKKPEKEKRDMDLPSGAQWVE